MDNPLSKLLNFYKSRNFVQAEKEYLNIAKKVKPNHELLNLYGVILFELKKFFVKSEDLFLNIEALPNSLLFLDAFIFPPYNFAISCNP